MLRLWCGLQVVSLVGTNQQTKVLVLGLLTKLVEGKFHLEDDTGNVEVDLTNAQFKNGVVLCGK